LLPVQFFATPFGMAPHWLTVGVIEAPIGYPCRSLVTVAVHVIVLAPPRPALSHWVIPVTGLVDVVVPPVGQTAEPVQLTWVTIVAPAPTGVGALGSAALYVKSLVIVTVHVMVSPPVVPVSLHCETGAEAAKAASVASTLLPPCNTPVSPKILATPTETISTFRRSLGGRTLISRSAFVAVQAIWK
jgi:hypothetical protein